MWGKQHFLTNVYDFQTTKNIGVMRFMPQDIFTVVKKTCIIFSWLKKKADMKHKLSLYKKIVTAKT